ncbi:MAG: DUF4394 domain-containing protein [Chitinophagales bacterium]|nr:DUF4394 domain-containing protein [Chitinophagales bacterium]
MKNFFLIVFCMAVGLGMRAQSVYGLDGGNLIKFNTTDPELTSSTPITGVSLLETLVGLDFRPATGELYLLGYNNLAGVAQLYVLDTATADADTIGGPLAISLGSNNVSFDFNPVADRIRIITEDGDNYRVNPANGLLAATDTSLMYSVSDENAGQTPAIISVAYTNSFSGATSTMLYGLDNDLNLLVTINPPNGGMLQTVDTLDMDFDADADFDIGMNNMAYFVGSETGDDDSLYMLNLTTGEMTNMGQIGSGMDLNEIAVSINDISAIGERELALEAQVFPNPMGSQLQVKVASQQAITLTLTDLAGKLIMEQELTAGSQQAQMDVSQLNAGLYLLTMSNGQTSTVRKVSKL